MNQDVTVDRELQACDFVTYVGSYSDGKERQGLILNISRAERSAIAHICFLDTKEEVQVPLKRCAWLSADEVRKGLVGLYVAGETHRKLRVVEESVIDGLVHVALTGLDGLRSSLLPANGYRFCFTRRCM